MTTKPTNIKSAKPKSTVPAWVPNGFNPVYRDLMAYLRETDTFQPSDEPLIRLYIEALSNLRECQNMVRVEGVTTVSAQGMKPHPALTAQTSLNATISKIGAMLALGPAARKRIAATPVDSNQGASPWTSRKV